MPLLCARPGGAASSMAKPAADGNTGAAGIGAATGA